MEHSSLFFFMSCMLGLLMLGVGVCADAIRGVAKELRLLRDEIQNQKKAGE